MGKGIFQDCLLKTWTKSGGSLPMRNLACAIDWSDAKQTLSFNFQDLSIYSRYQFIALLCGNSAFFACFEKKNSLAARFFILCVMAGHTKSLWSFLPLCSEGNGKDMFSFVCFLKPDSTRKWNYSGLFLIRKKKFILLRKACCWFYVCVFLNYLLLHVLVVQLVDMKCCWCCNYHFKSLALIRPGTVYAS